MRQEAPFPDVLAKLVGKVNYRQGWRFTLDDIDRGQGSAGLTLIIDVSTVNSYPPHEQIVVRHYMIVPAASYDMRSWRRWLFDQCRLVDRHEACEFFEIDGDKPYAPSHGPGNDPYLIREVGTDVDRRTSFLGEVQDAGPAPEWAHSLLSALLTGEPLNFGGHTLPKDIAARLERAKADGTLGTVPLDDRA